MEGAEKRKLLCEASHGTPSEIGLQIIKLFEDDCEWMPISTDRCQLKLMKKAINRFKYHEETVLPSGIDQSIFKDLNHLKYIYSLSSPYIFPSTDTDDYYFKRIVQDALRDGDEIAKLYKSLEGVTNTTSRASTTKDFLKEFYIFESEEIPTEEIDLRCTELVLEVTELFESSSINKVGTIAGFLEAYSANLVVMEQELYKWDYNYQPKLLVLVNSDEFKALNMAKKSESLYNFLYRSLGRLREDTVQMKLESLLNLIVRGINANNRGITIDVERECIISPGSRIDLLIIGPNLGNIIIEVKRASKMKENFLSMINKAPNEQLESNRVFKSEFKQFLSYLFRKRTSLGIMSNYRTTILIVLGNDYESTGLKDLPDAIGISLRFRIIDNVSNSVTLSWGIVYMISKMLKNNQSFNPQLEEAIFVFHPDYASHQTGESKKRKLEKGDEVSENPHITHINDTEFQKHGYRVGNEYNSDIYKMNYQDFKRIFNFTIDGLNNEQGLVLKIFNFPPYQLSAALHYSNNEFQMLKLLENFNKHTEEPQKINCPVVYKSFRLTVKNSAQVYTTMGYCVVMNNIRGEKYDPSDKLQKELLDQQIENLRRINLKHTDLNEGNVIFVQELRKVYLIDWAFENIESYRPPSTPGSLGESSSLFSAKTQVMSDPASQDMDFDHGSHLEPKH